MIEQDSRNGKTRGDRLKRTVALVALGAAMLGGVAALADVIVNRATAERSVDYLNGCKQDTQTVGGGDTPQQLVDRANPQGLTPQQQADAEEFVRNQGAATDDQHHPELAERQAVHVPRLDECNEPGGR